MAQDLMLNFQSNLQVANGGKIIYATVHSRAYTHATFLK
jgi:hypothetical protein